MHTSARVRHLKRFYALIDRLERAIGGARVLRECNGRAAWPTRGVYFFREPGEVRSDSGAGLRIARVGTHALTSSSRASLWGRLSQHKGQALTGGGNHRGSIFRLLVGAALMQRHGIEAPTWGRGQTASRDVRDGEADIENMVSNYIGAMPFVWLAVDDPPGVESQRRLIERHSIGLLSNFNRDSLDGPSNNWLGHQSDRVRVRDSGLWNQSHVQDNYDPTFLDVLDKLVMNHEG